MGLEHLVAKESQIHCREGDEKSLYFHNVLHWG